MNTGGCMVAADHIAVIGFFAGVAVTLLVNACLARAKGSADHG